MIEDFGFIKAGSWIKSENKSTKHLLPIQGINFLVSKDILEVKNVVYSFIVDKSILYIGETTVGMKSRFSGYRYGNTLESDTDNRIKIAITDHLLAGREVDIWYCKPISKFIMPNGDYLEIPASKPIEEHLIEIYKPDLNVKNINTKS